MSTRNGADSGGGDQRPSTAAPQTSRSRPDHFIAAAAERLRSTCVLRLWPRPTRPCLPTPRLSLRSAIYDNEPIIYVDDRELSWREFGRLMTTYAGWGVRIVFVPDDELHEEPQIEIREPEEKRRQ